MCKNIELEDNVETTARYKSEKSELRSEQNPREYHFKENKREERYFEIKEEGLIYRSTLHGEYDISFNNIKRVRLLSPLKDVFSLTIETKSGGKFIFANRTLKSFGEFEYQNDLYYAFLKELHNQLKEYPNIKFDAGSSSVFWLFATATPTVILLTIAMVVISITTGSRTLLSTTVGLVIIIPLAIHYLNKGRSIDYDPEYIPLEYTHLSSIQLNVIEGE